MHLPRTALIWIALTSSAVAQETPDPLPGQPISKHCGAVAVALAARRVAAADVSFDDVQRVVDVDGDGWCSVADIIRGCHAFGLEADAARCSTETQIRRPCILLVKSDVSLVGASHFVYAEPAPDTDDTIVYSAPLSVGPWHKDQLANVWNGDVVWLAPHGRALSRWLIGAWTFASAIAFGLLSLRILRRRSGPRQ